MAVDCSELAQTLTDIAMNIGSRPGINTLDDVTREAQKLIPGIRRQSISDAIVEATERPSREADDLLKKLSAIKQEARTDKALRNKIIQLENTLKRGALIEGPKRQRRATQAIEQLRTIRDDLKKKIARSEPTQKKRLQDRIAELNRKLETGDFLPRQRPQIPKTKELERLEFERDELQRQIRRKIRDLKPRTIWEHIAEPFNTARGIITSFEFSPVFRQGGFIAFGNPVRTSKSIMPMIRALFSEKKAAQIMQSIQDRPNAPLYRKAKLFLAPIDGTHKLSEREEIMQARLLDKIPGVRGFNRAYTTFLNLVRADSFDTMVATLSKSGEATLDEAKAIGNFVNVATGRGSLGALEQAALPLNTIFFAPRYVASRFQLILGQPFFGGNARTRKLIAKEYAKYLIGMTLIYALGRFAGADVEDDPRSADFGKMRFGKTRLDPLSGISQPTVLLSRLVKGELKSSVTGEVRPLRGEDVPFGRGDAAEVTARFLRSKLSPMFGKTLDLAAGENVVGEKVTLKGTIADLTIPLAYRDLFEALQEQGIPKTAAMSMLVIFGMGMQTYGSQTTGRQTTKTFTGFETKEP